MVEEVAQMLPPLLVEAGQANNWSVTLKGLHPTTIAQCVICMYEKLLNSASGRHLGVPGRFGTVFCFEIQAKWVKNWSKIGRAFGPVNFGPVFGRLSLDFGTKTDPKLARNAEIRSGSIIEQPFV